MTRINRSNLLLVLTHVVGWVLYTFISIAPVLIIKGEIGKRQEERFIPPQVPINTVPLSEIILSELSSIVVMALYFYWISLFLVPRYLIEKRYLAFKILILISLVVTLIGSQWARESISWFTPNLFAKPIFGTLFWVRNIATGLLVTALAMALGLWTGLSKQRELAAAITNRQLNSELDLLKSQLSPHFLFNTLNNLRSLIRKGSDQSEKVVLQISELLRFVVYDSREALVPVPREVDYIRNFNELQELRLPQGSTITVKIDPAVNTYLMPPMLLVPLVENVYKHGGHKSLNWQVMMDVRLDADWLTFIVVNTVNTDLTAARLQQSQDGGVGLNNLKRRLELLFGTHFSLTTHQADEWFTATLSFPLTKSHSKS